MSFLTVIERGSESEGCVALALVALASWAAWAALAAAAAAAAALLAWRDRAEILSEKCLSFTYRLAQTKRYNFYSCDITK